MAPLRYFEKFDFSFPWIAPLPAPPSRNPRKGRDKVLPLMYRVTPLVVANYGCVDFDLDVPPSCPIGLPILTNSHQPRQNLTDSGMNKIKVNPTRLCDHLSPCTVKWILKLTDGRGMSGHATQEMASRI